MTEPRRTEYRRMSETPKPPDDRLLDAFLDGALTEQQRADFARQAASQRELEAELQLQSRIDGALRNRFAPPAAPADLTERLREATAVVTVPYPGRRRRRIFALTAAAAVVWAIAAWQFFSPANRRPVYDPRLPMATIYETRVKEGFQPTWVCDNDHQFASTFFDRQGQGLLLAAMPEGSKMVGLAYCGGLSRYTTTMLRRWETRR